MSDLSGHMAFIRIFNVSNEVSKSIQIVLNDKIIDFMCILKIKFIFSATELFAAAAFYIIYELLKFLNP